MGLGAWVCVLETWSENIVHIHIGHFYSWNLEE